ncbi:hypothetical protein EQG49_05335 [Periweissella cryptocerci]|uniref:Uncharacterized protein n=1 Tax=Periweissella cryptocerci TaxID=2506420 RepID=A0A4P6YTC3_9LACO|nr:hypothetical protein [Periweissella cryptocerci]QBO35922.1 hypothetical protein EQG49_05335 [Periweissella cryptocerci]
MGRSINVSTEEMAIGDVAANVTFVNTFDHRVFEKQSGSNFKNVSADETLTLDELFPLIRHAYEGTEEKSMIGKRKTKGEKLMKLRGAFPIGKYIKA